MPGLLDLLISFPRSFHLDQGYRVDTFNLDSMDCGSYTLDLSYLPFLLDYLTYLEVELKFIFLDHLGFSLYLMYLEMDLITCP